MRAFCRRRRLVNRALAPALLAACLVSPTVHADNYIITDLGTDFIPRSINDAETIIGVDTLDTSLNNTIPKIYNDGIITELTAGGNDITDINETELISGFSQATPNVAQLWDNGQPSPELSTYSNLTEARSLNAFNEVVGITLVDGLYQRPFFYDMFIGRMKTLGTLGGAEAWANDINENGQIFGGSLNANGNSLGFRFSDSKDDLVSLGTLNGYQNSEAWSSNDDNTVVGWAYNLPGSRSGKRAFYAPENGGIINISTLDNDIESIARGISNTGIIVGQSTAADGTERAFIYDTSVSDSLVIAIDPNFEFTNRIYAYSTSGTGILRSEDGGDSWQTINRGLTNLTINSLIINPDNTQILYAATNSNIYKSVDGGNSWSPVPDRLLEDIAVRSLHFDETDRERVYAGTDFGIVYTTNGGDNWILAENTNNFSTYNFASHPGVPSRVVAATDSGVYVSYNRGENWSRQNGQDSNRLLTRFVNQVVIDPNDAEIVYAATRGGGVFVSENLSGSLSWNSVPLNGRITNGNVFALAAYVNNDGETQLYAGTTTSFFRIKPAVDILWEKVTNLGDNGVFTLTLHQGSTEGKSIMYATTLNGDILVTTDAGANELAINWTAKTRGVSTADIFALATIPLDSNDPTSETLILGGATNGIIKLEYKNINDADSWSSPASGATAGNLKITSFAFDTSTSPYTLWAGSRDRGVLVSSDGGNRWLFSNNGLGSWNVNDIVIDKPASSTVVMAATLGGVYRSDDGGENWVNASSGLGNASVFSLALDNSVSPPLLYAGTADGVYRSSDYGRFWTPLAAVMPPPTKTEVVTLLLDSSGNLFAGSLSQGLFITTNGGQSWQSVNDPGPPAVMHPIYDIAENPFVPGDFLTATSNGVHTISCTSFAPVSCSWRASNTGLEDATVYSVAYDPDNANHVYAATLNLGIQKSADLGDSWGSLNKGIAEVNKRMIDLNTQHDKTTEWKLKEATAINNNNQIVGWGYVDGDSEPHGFLLTPAIGTSTADLVLSQRTEPETIKKGIPFTYQLSINNLGPDSETGVILTNWLPTDVLFRTVSSSSGSCKKNDDDVIRCTLGELPPGETLYVNISLESPEADVQIRNIARVTGNMHDPDFSNNSTRQGLTTSVDKCFIATAAYGSFLHPYVTELRRFRDDHLLTNQAGRLFVSLYYEHSPPLAAYIAQHETLRTIARLVLTPIVFALTQPRWALALLLLLILTWVTYKTRSRRCNSLANPSDEPANSQATVAPNALATISAYSKRR